MTPRLAKAPGQIETPRLLLRISRVADAAELNAAIRESFRELHPWVPWAKLCPTLAQTKKFCQLATRGFVARKDFQFTIRLKDPSGKNPIVGGGGLIRGDWSVPRFEIGYWLSTRFTGHGYIAETVAALEQYARRRLKIRRLEIRIDPRNTRSARVAERAGFVCEGILRHNIRDNRGRLSDTKVFAKVF